MKILVICQYYYPEPFRVSDICEELAKRGHDVTAVTGTPNYPMGEVYQGYEDGKRTDEIINGVKVHRCKIRPRKTGAVNRFRNYISYPRSAKRYIKTLPNDFDVVFVNQLSPVMMAEPGLLYKKKHHKEVILYCLDLWPESLRIGGIKKGSLAYKIFEKISRNIYRNVDKILITSRSFKNYLISTFDIDANKIEYLPQYAEAQFLELKDKKKEGSTFDLLFAGNLGTAQSVSTIIEAADILKEKNIKFHIVGDGVEIQNLKRQASNLQNVIFYGRKALEEMPKYYEMADAMLVTMVDDPVISLTLPGKVQTYMAAGKPIVGAINGETKLILEESQGGYCGRAGDSKELALNIIRLMESNKTKELGESNRKYYLDNFSKNQFIDFLLKQFE